MLDPRLAEAMSDVFGIPSEEVTPDSSSDTIADWDSVGHLKLILHLEDQFKVRFPTSEIPNLSSAQKIQKTLDELKGSQS